MSRDITPDEDDPLLDLGRAVHETSYAETRRREITLEGMKIDMIRNKESGKVICEVKSSSRHIRASTMQLLYYLYRMEEMGIDASGEIVVPKEKKRITVKLDDTNREELMMQLRKIKQIVAMNKPPKAEFITFCRRCAYRYFCWSI